MRWALCPETTTMHQRIVSEGRIGGERVRGVRTGRGGRTVASGSGPAMTGEGADPLKRDGVGASPDASTPSHLLAPC